MSNMEFLEMLKEKLSTVTHKVVKKSNEIVDSTKLSYAISNEENDLKKKYERIGRMVYEAKTGDSELSDEINTLCDDIALSLEKLEELKEQLQVVKNKKECPHCGHEMPADAQFCSTCGCSVEKND